MREIVTLRRLFLLLARYVPNVAKRSTWDHPPARLPSRKPIWSDMTSVDVTSRWRADWQSSSVSNRYLISDPTTRPADFDLRRSTWSLLNQFRTGQGHCAANLHKWRMAASDKCQCGEVQTMSHIVESCSETRFSDGGLVRLHSADDHAVTWLQEVAVKAFAKWKCIYWGPTIDRRPTTDRPRILENFERRYLGNGTSNPPHVWC